jgi:predicted NAD-dependent protein-ADP-ribosyltransferase YbiA (DUF1768 family)
MIIDQNEARKRATDAILALLASNQEDPRFFEKIVTSLIGDAAPGVGATAQDRARNHWMLLQQTVWVGVFIAKMATEMSSREMVTNMLIDYRDDRSERAPSP